MSTTLTQAGATGTGGPPIPSGAGPHISTVSRLPVTVGTAASSYDVGHFQRSEYHARAHGQIRSHNGVDFTVGARYAGAAHQGAARRGDFYSLTSRRKLSALEVVCGDFLPAAMALLARDETEIVVAQGGAAVVAHGRVVAAFDAATNTAGDRDGASRGTTYQWAAVLAYHLARPDRGREEQFLRDALEDLIRGAENLIAAQDEAYLYLAYHALPMAPVGMGGTLTEAPRAAGPEGATGGPQASVGAATPVAPHLPQEAAPPPVPVAPPSFLLPAYARAIPAPQAPPWVPLGTPLDPAADLATPVERVLSRLPTVPSPDQYLCGVPREHGGQLDQPLDGTVPTGLGERFTIDASGARALLAVAALSEWGSRSTDAALYWAGRHFGFYGPPGSGKNALAREIAAHTRHIGPDGVVRRGVPLLEVTVTPHDTVESLLGGTILKGGETRIKLGRVGVAAMAGWVVAINEINTNQLLQAALQPLLEDGELIIQAASLGAVRLPIHPAARLILTWNPGANGLPDRIAQAPLTRLTALHIEGPSQDERLARLGNSLRGLGIGADAPRQDPTVDRRLAAPVVPASVDYPRALLERLLEFGAFITRATSVGGGGIPPQIGALARSSTDLGPRGLTRFALLGPIVGWEEAARIYEICADQQEDRERQFGLIREEVRRLFGIAPMPDSSARR
jgi:hypothetical protein